MIPHLKEGIIALSNQDRIGTSCCDHQARIFQRNFRAVLQGQRSWLERAPSTKLQQSGPLRKKTLVLVRAEKGLEFKGEWDKVYQKEVVI